eukprot:1191622-Prorocentrum_minimum.AAC.1
MLTTIYLRYQVALRWVNQQGVLLATSPGENAEYMQADLNLHSFTLADEEMDALRNIPCLPPSPPPPAPQSHINILDDGSAATAESRPKRRPHPRALTLGRRADIVNDDKHVAAV